MDNLVALGILAVGMTTFFLIGIYSRRWTSSTAEYYVAGGQIPWKLNGVAMFSNYASGASFLGVAGAVALIGIDKWWLALGFFAAWVVVVLVLASPLRRSGKYTVADALQERFSGPEIRLLTIIAGITIGTLYLVPQLVGAGHLFNLLVPGLDYFIWVAIAGGFTAIIVVMGGMRGTTYNQAFQGIIIFGAMVLLLVLAVVAYFDWNPFEVLTESDSVVPPNQVVAAQAVDQVLGDTDVGSTGEAAMAAALQSSEVVWLKDQNVAVLVAMTFGIAASTFAPILLLTVWWRRLTRQGVIAGFSAGLVVSLLFTFAEYSGVEELSFIPVLENPALYGVPSAFATAIIVSLLTKDVGRVDHFMALAHDRHGTIDGNGGP